MLVKKLVQHGNSKAIVIESSMLKSAGLDENALFHITVDSSSGITIQSVKPVHSNFSQAKERILKKHSKIFKNLADR